MDELWPGRATEEGTRRYAQRFPELRAHFRCPDRLWLSSLGMGTRPGDPGGVDDLAYRSTVAYAFESGINVVDTALSYRLQTSERALGAALRRAFASEGAARDELCVVTKGGYLTIDPDFARSRHEAQNYLYRTYIDSGLVDADGLVNGRHSLDRAFIRDQIERSRRNLGLATLDVYCLQDPELHLAAKGPDEFRRILVQLIETLEEAVDKGSIGDYGFSTWSGFLVPHSERGHLSIAELMETALDVGGADHHLRAIQLPYSVAMGEALGLPSQFGTQSRPTAVLEMLRETGTVVFTVAPLVQGRVVRGLPEFLRRAMPGLETDAQRALQFARSSPGVTTTLVGMRSQAHVDENLAVARAEPLAPETIATLFDEARKREPG